MDRTTTPAEARRGFEQAVDALVEAAAWERSNALVADLGQVDGVAQAAGVATDYTGGCASGDGFRWLAEAEARGMRTDGDEDPLDAGETAVLDALDWARETIGRIEMRAGEQAEQARQQARARRLKQAELLAEARDRAAAGAGAEAGR